MKGLIYAVDIVVCVDSTGSMGNVIGRVKERALRFHDDLSNTLTATNKHVDQLRIRVIEFRDIYADGEHAIRESSFFTLPNETEAFGDFMQGINAGGGGDVPESGLEALALAVRSDWTQQGDKRRHVIVVWTDTGVHPLEKAATDAPALYPSGMPANFDELTDMWEGQDGMNHAAKRLVIFAPDSHGWSEICTHWSNVVCHTSRAGEGLSDVDYGEIIALLANSV